ncbi:SAM-dependent methyltransferase [Gordonia sp. CPCC 206044]|uniref:SAM-dependent methyltransferase n=1 Tax=Gordonia sp. CPCC 206044 TaxID=3140793 RepID=UPI003AF3DCFB
MSAQPPVPEAPTTGVAVTALGVAIIRARETDRPDRLYSDPLAQHFVDAAHVGFDKERWSRLTELAGRFYGGRTIGVRLVDDRLRAAAANGIRQFVLVGAGLDTRAYRLGLPADASVFEIDVPELFAFKEPVLRRAGAAATCSRAVVTADLRSDWVIPLRDSGFHSEVPTMWIDEGTLGSLNQEWSRRVVRRLSAVSAPGSLYGTGQFATDATDSRYRDLRGLVGDTPGGDDASSTAEPNIRGWLENLGWDTAFHSWNSMVADLDRPATVDDESVGTISAVRR